METVPKNPGAVAAPAPHLARRAVAGVGVVWLLLLLVFGVYYFWDQQSRGTAPQQTSLKQQIERAEDAVRKNPADAVARTSIGDLYAMDGRYEEAAQQYEETLKINEKNLPAINGLATVYAALGRPEKAQPFLEKALTLGDGNKLVSASADMADVRLQLGRIYLSQGRVQDAQAQAREAARISPANSDVLLLMGDALAAGSDFAAAVEQYRKALRFVPRFPEAYEAMAAAYEGLGDSAHAEYARAMVTYSHGDYAAAAGNLEKLLRSNPGLAEAHLGLGMAYERLSKTDQAVTEYREALRLDPQLDYAKARLAALGKE